MNPRPIIYCATSNKGKLREFQLAAPDFDIRQLPTPVEAPEETGDTFEENAAIKALGYGAHTSEYLFADDSGIEVDALNGAPGVHSARYAGGHATTQHDADEQNNALLLTNLQGVQNRTARFVSVIALVKAGKLVATFRGAVEGRIVDPAAGETGGGTTGFGYDPLFYYPPFGCTFGQATLEQKMSVSHRAIALEKMFAYLRQLQSR
jgi:XTP/dITP diphosphohydrolase